MRLFSHKHYGKYVTAMALLQPLGLNNSAYAGTTRQRLATFKKRLATNTKYQLLPLLTDRRLRYNHRVFASNVNLGGAKAQAQYNSDLMYDAVPDLKKLHKAIDNIVIICGANDTLFPPNELKSTLAKHAIAIDVQSIKNVPHSPLATKLGQKILKRAFDYFEESLAKK